MKKITQIIIVFLAALYFVGCGDEKSEEKKSAGVIMCEEEVTKMALDMPKKLHDMGSLTDQQYAKAVAEGEASVKACGHYEGGPSKEELGPWMMGGEMKKHAQQYIK